MAAQSSRQPGKIKTSVNNFRCCCCCFFFNAEDQNYDKLTDFIPALQTRQKLVIQFGEYIWSMLVNLPWQYSVNLLFYF